LKVKATGNAVDIENFSRQVETRANPAGHGFEVYFG
jgi:hypothetical protein